MRKEPQLIRFDFEADTTSVSKALSKLPQNWRIFISNLKLKGLIGIYPIEKIEPQLIVVNVSVMYRASVPQDNAASEQVVCYQNIVNGIEQLVADRHIMFVENLAEEIAEQCLEDSRVIEVTVRVEKPDAIKDAASVGVEIIRQRANETIALMS
ncbi:MAG: dihydroneopterin aldolase [Pseudomonadota bacterium]|nr:dihydroneopterin aldolase [Pseudomonadota bacterium]